MVRPQGSLQREIQEVWVEVGSRDGLFEVTAGLLGCEIGVVVGDFQDPQSAFDFAMDFKIGKVAAVMHGSEWNAYVREVHEYRKFDPPILAHLLSRSGIASE